jgi:hypothetical protein
VSIRAVILGLLLASLIAATTYFNDWVINQTLLIGNHLPISVFGSTVLVLLLVNPLIMRVSARRMFSGREIAVIAAIALAGCGWPGSTFYRKFVSAVGMPAHWQKTSPTWQSTQVMSYVPGGSPELALGHVQDWKRLIDETARAAGASEPSPLKRMFAEFTPQGQRGVLDGSKQRTIDPSAMGDLLRELNRALNSKTLYAQDAFTRVPLDAEAQRLLPQRANLGRDDLVRLNRALVSSALPGVLLPPPQGDGLLLAGGRADPFAADTLVQGRAANNQLSIWELPWRTWGPTLAFWMPLAVLMGVMALCFALIVHPQWSERELLAYPVARFMEELSGRDEGRALPNLVRDRMFWLGFVPLFLFHVIDGLHVWFTWVPEIPRALDFNPLKVLFPNASKIWLSMAYFNPTIYASVIAFCFFMTTSVSFSLGIGHFLFIALATFLLTQGIPMEWEAIGAKKANLMRFGAYAGIATIVLYTGRRYYVKVAGNAFAFMRSKEAPNYATWAARVAAVCAILFTVLLHRIGLDWLLAVCFVGLMCLMHIVMSRIVSETGAFYIESGWVPVGVMTGLFGFDLLGPTGYIIVGVLSAVFLLDPREILMPYLSTALRLADKTANVKPARIVPWLGIACAVSLGLAGVVTIWLLYNHGVMTGDSFARHDVPVSTFDTVTQYISTASAEGTLAQATRAQGLEHWKLFEPDSGAFPWVGFGLVLAIGTAAARLRLPWWPLHPVAFAVWGTWPMIVLAFSFFLGWIVKASVVSIGGARAYHQLKPLMIGVIAGELAISLTWTAVGAIYYFVTGQPPAKYNVYPF